MTKLTALVLDAVEESMVRMRDDSHVYTPRRTARLLWTYLSYDQETHKRSIGDEFSSRRNSDLSETRILDLLLGDKGEAH